MQNTPPSKGGKGSKGSKGSRQSNNLYKVPGSSRPSSIRDAAYYFVGEVLSTVGGRAKVDDVLDDVNEAFLAVNPGGWATTNTQKASAEGAFTAYGLRFMARAKAPAKPERWAVRRTFRLEDDELVLVGEGEDEDATVTEGSRSAEEGGNLAGIERLSDDDGGEDISDIDA